MHPLPSSIFAARGLAFRPSVCSRHGRVSSGSLWSPVWGCRKARTASDPGRGLLPAGLRLPGSGSAGCHAVPQLPGQAVWRRCVSSCSPRLRPHLRLPGSALASCPDAVASTQVPQAPQPIPPQSQPRAGVLGPAGQEDTGTRTGAASAGALRSGPGSQVAFSREGIGLVQVRPRSITGAARPGLWASVRSHSAPSVLPSSMRSGEGGSSRHFLPPSLWPTVLFPVVTEGFEPLPHPTPRHRDCAPSPRPRGQRLFAASSACRKLVVRHHEASVCRLDVSVPGFLPAQWHPSLYMGFVLTARCGQRPRQ